MGRVKRPLLAGFFSNLWKWWWCCVVVVWCGVNTTIIRLRNGHMKPTPRTFLSLF